MREAAPIAPARVFSAKTTDPHTIEAGGARHDARRGLFLIMGFFNKKKKKKTQKKKKKPKKNYLKKIFNKKKKKKKKN